MKVVQGLYYSKEHEWVRVEGEYAYIGITDYAQHSLGDIVFVELPEVDDELTVDDSFSVVESVKAASDVYTPVSGVIVEANIILEVEPQLLNQNPYENWIVKLELDDLNELDKLMNSEEYQKFCEKQ
ncbi:MAG: gcvH [Haloplasmataceae bacterium]|nr:gcvH [Haloplasmataceae bacterium]